MSYQGLNAYRRTEVQSRTSLELVVMLYDGALRFVALTREAMARKDIRARRDATSRLLAILSELQSTLDVERGGEVARSHDALYAYMVPRNMEAAAGHDPQPLDEVRKHLDTLRDGWQTIAPTPPAIAGSAGGPPGTAERPMAGAR
jgi:flagellar protein FliS